MSRWFFRFVTVFVISFLTGYLGITFSACYFNIMFALLGAIFAVALKQILSFSFAEIQNQDFVEQLRTHLTEIKKIFIILFVFVTLIFLLFDKITTPIAVGSIKISVTSFFGCFNLFFLFYFIVNCMGLSRLKHEIDDFRRLK